MNKLTFRQVTKVLFFIISDTLSVYLAVLLSMMDNSSLSSDVQEILFIVIPCWIPIHIISFSCFKLYNRLWAYAGINEMIRVIVASFCSMIFLVPVMYSLGMSIHVFWFISISIFTTVFAITTRFSKRMAISLHNLMIKAKNKRPCRNIMIIGAGDAGSSLLRDIAKDKLRYNINVVCVIDDDVRKQNKYICGIKVIGGRNKILWAAEKFKIDDIIFAIPSANSETRSKLLELCKKSSCVLKTLPNLAQILKSQVSFSMLRKVEIEDLLGRPQIKLNLTQINNSVSGKRVLVTGAGGSIGSELCRQLAIFEPDMLILLDIYENTTYFISNELEAGFPNLKVVTLIGSVRDADRLEYLFSTYRPQIVYHAAAHKHVPLMEISPNESVKNNVVGTLNTVRMAEKFRVSRFVLISTDKAVNPTSIMGATKRICEMIIQVYDRISKTDFVAVRFGNVLGSNGSVIPIFEKQIAEGGPVTVTHPDILRYFMTIPEAVTLVLQAGALAHGGEIFALDMGEPVKILKLAENLIRLSGKEPYRDIPIEFTGLRPGEKLYEELLMAEEGLIATKNDKIFICKPLEIDVTKFRNQLKILTSAMYDESNDIRAIVKEIVPSYMLPVDDKADISVYKQENAQVAITNNPLQEQKLAIG